MIVNSGGIAAIVDYANESKGNARLPGIMTLGYTAAFSETLALAVIVSKGVAPLAHALVTEQEEHIQAAAAWSLGQIGRHSPDHAKTLADCGVLPKLLRILTAGGGGGEDGGATIGADLHTKTKRALKCILEKTLHIESLEPMLNSATPTNILKYVCGQFAKILPHDVTARRDFVTSGSLQRLQEIASLYVATTSAGSGASENKTQEAAAALMAGTKMGEYIRTINECYPEEIIRYYSPGYSATLLQKV